MLPKRLRRRCPSKSLKASGWFHMATVGATLVILMMMTSLSTHTPNVVEFKPKQETKRSGADSHRALNVVLKPRQDTNRRDIYIQQREFSLLVANPGGCKGLRGHRPVDREFDFGNDVLLLLVVRSRVGASQRRDVIRRTWGDEDFALLQFPHRLKMVVRRVFVMGTRRAESVDDRRRIRNESARYGDIVQWNIDENNRTALEVAFYGWFLRRCALVPFVCVSDDDVFVNTINVAAYLRPRVASFRFTSGSFIDSNRTEVMLGAEIARDGGVRITDPQSKDYVSSRLYEARIYPPYLSGRCFLISGRLVRRLHIASLRASLFPMRDAFLGVLLDNLSVKPQHDSRFVFWDLRANKSEHAARRDIDACDVRDIFAYRFRSEQQMNFDAEVVWWELQQLYRNEILC